MKIGAMWLLWRGPAVNIVSTAEVLHLHGCMPGTDISLAGVSDDHEPIIDPSGVAIAHAVLASTELARQSVARLLELVSDSPEKLLAGDVDLIGPEWVPGSSLINKSLGS